MSAHITDELPRLLTGEANRDTVLSAAAHLRTCVDCQHELVSAVVAHASLTSAQRFAPEIVSRPESPAITADAGSPGDAAAPLPDLSAVFEQVRREAAEGYAPPREPVRRDADRSDEPRGSRRVRILAAAAAAAVVVGGGVAIYAATSGNGTPGTRTVALAAYDTGSSAGTARIGDGTIDVSATSLPRMASKRYEIWLTNTQRTRMQPIGWIGNNGTAHLTVPTALMSRYNDLEISVQDVGAANYNYSGTSVLRGAMD